MNMHCQICEISNLTLKLLVPILRTKFCLHFLLILKGISIISSSRYLNLLFLMQIIFRKRDNGFKLVIVLINDSKVSKHCAPHMTI